MIETYAYARAGFLGNPSDGYHGKTIAFIMKNFRARVLLYPSARLEIKPSKADIPIWENLDDLESTTRWRGYYGGIRIIQAVINRFIRYAKANGNELHDRNFTVEYESTIPMRLGMGGSSAIITASLRALMQYFEIDIPKPVQANLVLETETEELGVSAGLQDRVIQVYEGAVFMDFGKEHFERDGYGRYEPIDPEQFPNVYVAYRQSLGEGTEVFHNNIRGRYDSGDQTVIAAMQEWAEIAEKGKQAIEEGDREELGRLVNRNFDLRSEIYQIGAGNMAMIEAARDAGATAKFAGSGGAIVGTYRDEAHFAEVQNALGRHGIAVIQPKIQ